MILAIFTKLTSDNNKQVQPVTAGVFVVPLQPPEDVMDDTPCVIWVEYDSEHDTETIPQQFRVYTQMLSSDKKNLQGATAEAMDGQRHGHLLSACPTIGCGPMLPQKKCKAGGPHSQNNMCMRHCKLTCLLSPDGCDFSQVGLLGGCCNMNHWRRSFGADAEKQLDEETLGLLSCVFDLQRFMFSPRMMPRTEAARDLVQSVIGFDFQSKVSMASLVLLDAAKRVAMACPHANDPVAPSGGLKLALQRLHMARANKATSQKALAAVDPLLSSWRAATSSIGPVQQGANAVMTTPIGPGVMTAGQEARNTAGFPVGPGVNLLSLFEPKNAGGVAEGLTTTHAVEPGANLLSLFEPKNAGGVAGGLTTTHAVEPGANLLSLLPSQVSSNVAAVGQGVHLMPLLQPNASSGATAGSTTLHPLGLGMNFTMNQLDVTKAATKPAQNSGDVPSELEITTSQSYQIDTMETGDIDIWSDQSLTSPMHDEAGSGTDEILLSADEDTMATVRFLG